jgi:hypothetical protein
MLLQQLPHWQHLQAIVTASPNAGRLAYRQAHYPVLRIAMMKYLPETRPAHVCSRTVPDLGEQPGRWQVAWFLERRKILPGRPHSLTPFDYLDCPGTEPLLDPVRRSRN